MIRIITDSAADFTQEELRQLDIRCVPMTISFSDETYRDGVDLTSETFWQRMHAGETPKTSQPSPDAFLSEFEEAKACGDSVICILISTALSGTVQSAMIARDMADDDSIQIIDDWSEADYAYLVTCLRGTLEGGGVLFGAFGYVNKACFVTDTERVFYVVNDVWLVFVKQIPVHVSTELC